CATPGIPWRLRSLPVYGLVVPSALPCIAAAPVEAVARRDARPGNLVPSLRTPRIVADAVSAAHRDGGLECIIGEISSPRFPMRNILVLAVVALVVSGCGVIYKQPIYQGNLLEQSAVEQLQPGMSKQQVVGLLGSPSI